MTTTAEAQLKAARRYNEKQKQAGNKALTVVLPPELYNFVQELRATNPGGFNFSEFVKDSLRTLAKSTGHKLES